MGRYRPRRLVDPGSRVVKPEEAGRLPAPPSPSGPVPGTAARSTTSWRPAAAALFAVAFGANVPTPLLPLYAARQGLSTAVLTAVFATYAGGLMVALLVAGPASDRLGRRRVVLPFVALAGVAAAVFPLAADRLPLLFLGRFLQGVTSGAVFGPATAWLSESDAAPAERSSRRTSIVLTSGFAAGPTVSGLLAQWAPAPTVLPFAAYAAVVAGGFALAARGTETVSASRGRLALAVPAQAGVVARRTAVVAVSVFALPSLSVVVLPLALQDALGGLGLAVNGALAGVTLASGALVQPLSRRLDTPATAVAGLLLGGAGLLAGAAAVGLVAWPLLLVAAPLLGAGGGLCLTAGLVLTTREATDETRGGLVAVFYALAYLGFAAPFLVTALSGPFGTPAVLAAAGALMAACAPLVHRAAARE